MVAIYDTQNIQVATNIPASANQFVLANTSTQPLIILTAGNSNPPRPTRVSYTAPATPQPVVVTEGKEEADQRVIDSALFTSPTPTSVSTQAPPTNTNPTRTQRLSYVGLATIILLSILSIYLTPRREKGE